jgi:hypothetical protein
MSVICVLAACGSSHTRPPLDAGLVDSADLPGTWDSFEPQSDGPRHDPCGRPVPDHPAALESAAVAWAVDPSDGPIFGERIARYEDADQAMSVLYSDTALPCDFESPSGARWHAEWLDDPAVGDLGRVYLVTSRDGPDSFNYEVAIVSGDTVVGVEHTNS